MDAGFQLEQRAFASDDVVLQGPAVLLVERGELRTWLAPGEPSRLAEADVLALGRPESARLRAGRQGAQALVFRVQGEWLARALALAGLEPESALPRAATLRGGTHAARRAALRLRELVALASEPSAEARLARCADALELLGIAFAASAERPSEAPRQRRSAARVALADALGALAREPRQGLRLASLAAQLGLSQRQASRLVHERLGQNLGAHVTELRVACAKRLLAGSDLAVIDVAAEAGFGSLGHFNQVFRSRCGSTPSAFRASARRPGGALQGAPAQPSEPAGGAAACDGVRARDALASRRSSRFTLASTHAARETLPS